MLSQYKTKLKLNKQVQQEPKLKNRQVDQDSQNGEVSESIDQVAERRGWNYLNNLAKKFRKDVDQTCSEIQLSMERRYCSDGSNEEVQEVFPMEINIPKLLLNSDIQQSPFFTERTKRV